MLNTQELEEYKELVERANKAKATMQDMQTEINLHKSQCIAILKEYGYTNFSDLPKMEAKIAELEKTIKEEKDSMISYIQYVDEKKQQKESIMLG